jgi:hypothetical protein
MLNRQLAFDRVAIHLLTQNKESLVPTFDFFGGFKCVYRAPDGCKCGIGALIPDDHYRPELEGNGVAALEVWRALDADLGANGGDIGDVDFMVALQQVHDRGKPEQWVSRLSHMARIYSLNTFAIRGFLAFAKEV